MFHANHCHPMILLAPTNHPLRYFGLSLSLSLYLLARSTQACWTAPGALPGASFGTPSAPMRSKASLTARTRGDRDDERGGDRDQVHMPRATCHGEELGTCSRGLVVSVKVR